MNEKDKNILIGATELFTRYGFKKTTMGDIAEQAQISRQTLYSKYDNKHDVMVACLLMIADKMLTQIEAEWTDCDDLATKLAIYLRISVLEPYQAIQTLPDADDLMMIYQGMSEDTRADMDNQKINLLASAFEPYAHELAEHHTTPIALSEYIMRSAEGFKPTAKNIDHLKSMLNILQQSVMMMMPTA